MLIDTHAHLNFPDYSSNVGAVIDRAIDNGVTKIICASSNIADSIKAVELARKYPKKIYASVGIHPQQTDPQNPMNLSEQIEQLKRLVVNKEVVGLGECGLDYSPVGPQEKPRDKEDQIYLFKELIKLSIQNQLPLIVHSREAFADTVEILNNYPAAQGVIHCYTGGKKGIAKIQSLGLFFGVDGNITYDEGLQNVFKLIPLEQTLLETDSPYLTPDPFRGQINEPKNIKLIAEKLAQIKNLPFDKVAKITSLSCLKLFRL